jgi:adenylate cyclase
MNTPRAAVASEGERPDHAGKAPWGFRLSIGPKLIGLVSVLLFLMLAVAAYSYWKTKSMTSAVGGLSEELLPLVNALNEVEVQMWEQQVALERALRLAERPSEQAGALEAALRRFRALGREVREALREAKRQARDAASRAVLPEDAAQLGGVRATLRVLQREHNYYQTHALERLAADGVTTPELQAEEGPDQSVEAIRASWPARDRELIGDVARLEDELRSLRSELGDFTQERATRLGESQAQRLWLSLQNLALTGGAFLLGVLVAAAVTRRIVRPIKELVRAANRVEGGNLDVEVVATSRDEVGELARAFNTMVAGLRARERVKETFGKYLDPRIVEDVVEGGGIAEAGGERQVMTVFFSDVAGFSGISEQLTPSGLVKVINRYLTLATIPIARHSGVVDKFVGDAVMAFWGPPFTSPADHARLACQAALEQFDQLDEFRRQLPELLGFRKGLPLIDIRVGLCTGDLVVGNIGSERAKSYTVMGDTVNIASRLEGVNKQYGTRILIAEETWQAVADDFETREVDNIMVVGKKEPTRVYELLARKGQLESAAMELRDAFEAGLQAYRNRDWDGAATRLTTCLEIDNSDGPAQVFLNRIKLLRKDSPPPDWDGVWRLQQK